MTRSPDPNGPASRKLRAFENFDEFLSYTRSLFDLSPDEYAALFNVLIKLESVGTDPVETMHTCRYDMSRQDCLDMLKFMIYVDGLDLGAIKEMV